MDQDGARILPSDLQSKFHSAASFVSHLSTGSLDVADRLRFYALFKIVTTSARSPYSEPISTKVSFWDFEAKAKYESWKSVWDQLNSTSISLISSITNSDPVDPRNVSKIVATLAANEYLERAKRLGWPDDQPNPKTIDLQDEIEPTRADPVSDREPELNSSQEDSKSSVDRRDSQPIKMDEYGLEILPTPTSSSTHSSSQVSTSAQPESSSGNLIMRSVSKLLPIEIEIEPADRSHQALDCPHGSLHDLVLDKHHTDVENYLIRLSSLYPDSNEFGKIIDSYRQGYTSFHLACDQGDLEKVESLLKFGIDPSLKDQNDQLTGLELAKEAGMDHIVEYLTARLMP